MAQLLFYENVAPVSPQRHGELSIDRADFGFAANVNSVPLMAVEMTAAASEYTIVFAGNEEAVAPVVILGLEGTKNQYVDKDGKWTADYIPAFVRRYPFVFAQQENTYTLCVDENWGGCNKDGKGDRLFDEKGERTEYLSRMLKFLEESQAHFVRTQTYCKHLKDLGLLEPMKADFTLPGGEKKSLGGFMAVNREKLRNLPGDKLAELAKTDELELTYIHLLSMNNFRRVLERTAKAAAPAAE
ncbi:MAG TPA: SapC family protein [Pirellulaceae bacterium]|nr:SapC family protein [Planctomycetales bacterium]MCB9938923.1 SapC family protein [Planctomycetaceae bacterium]HRX79787.1 SapC family protein [Pirellulaceae bacterium]